jgi:hypothetical protein
MTRFTRITATTGIVAAFTVTAGAGSTAVGQPTWAALTRQAGTSTATGWGSPPWFANYASVHVGAKRTGISIDNVSTGSTYRCRFVKHTGPFGRYLTGDGPCTRV